MGQLYNSSNLCKKLSNVIPTLKKKLFQLLSKEYKLGVIHIPLTLIKFQLESLNLLQVPQHEL